MPISFGSSKAVLFSKGQSADPMVLEIDTTKSTGLQYDLYFSGSGTPNYTVDWGDGTSNNYTTYGTRSKTYSIAGTYQIKISGTFTSANIGYGTTTTTNTNLKKLTKILSFGSLSGVTGHSGLCTQSSVTSVPALLPARITNIAYMFYDCTTINDANISLWNTSNVTDMSRMFFNASAFNQNLGSWNTGNVTSFNFMFGSATTFNNGGSADIGNWNTANVTDMRAMFSNTPFNQNIGGWNTSKVIFINSMFQGAWAFNNGGSPSINNWDTSKCQSPTFRDMFNGATAFNQPIHNWSWASAAGDSDRMFRNAAAFNNGGQPLTWTSFGNTNSFSEWFSGATSFNQNIGTWDVSKITNFGAMFFGATAFNNGGSSSINNWTLHPTSNISLASMFYGASAFNQPLNLWNTTNVTSLNSTFRNAVAFNQNIGSWNVSKVGDFAAMFMGATAFNNGGSSDINNWSINTTVGANMSMTSMFQNATSFNQPIGNWDVSSVYTFNNMFNTASAFNQNIGSWKLGANVRTNSLPSGQVTMPGMLNNVGMSVENYSKTLIGWANYIHNLNDDFTGKGPLFQANGKQVNSVEYGGAPFSNGVAARAFLSSRHATLNQNWRGAAVSNTGSIMFASGDSFIFKSTDGGNTWAARITNANRSYSDVTCSSDGTKVAAVNTGGSIWTSADSGETWTERTSAGTRNWQTIASSDDGSFLIAAVNNGFLYTSSDSGATWTARLSDTNRAWHGVASNSDGTKLVATVYNGQIYTSTDSGATWTARDSARAWRNCCSSADGVRLAAVVEGGGGSNIPNGYIFTSTDSGVTWTARVTDQLRAWNGVSCSSDGLTLAACAPVAHPGTGGYIYTSTDGGVTWTLRQPGGYNGARTWGGAIAVSGNGTTMIAGSYSTSGEISFGGAHLHRSTNSGVTWSRLAYPNSKSANWNISDSGIGDSTTFYADIGIGTSYSTQTPQTLFVSAGSNGTIFNSPTYSATWNGNLSFNGTNQYIIGSSNLGISGNAAFTIGGWVNMSEIPADYASFIGNNSTGTGGAGLSITMLQGRPALDFWNTRWRATSALAANTWYHIMVTKSAGAVSTTSKIYVNGVEVAAALEGGDGTPNIVNSAWILGRLNDQAGRYFNGRIASAIAYTRVLTAAEILDMYNAQKSRFILSVSPSIWLDAADSATITQSSNNISQWSDKQRNGIIAVQSNSIRQPTVQSNGQNGLSGVSFNGSQCLTIPNVTLTAFTTFTVYKASAHGFLYEHGENVNSNPGTWLYTGTSFAARTRRSDGFNDQKEPSPLDNNWGLTSSGRIVTHEFNNTSLSHQFYVGSTLRSSGGEAHTTVSSGNATGTWNIGSRNQTGVFLTGQIYEHLVFNRALSAQEKTEVQNYLSAKWNIPL